MKPTIISDTAALPDRGPPFPAKDRLADTTPGEMRP
jgi:hypothetical protein